MEHADEVFEGGRVKSSVLTGGSTGTPVRYPWSASDAATAFANMYTGRGWWGIRPFDAQVAFWGHGTPSARTGGGTFEPPSAESATSLEHRQAECIRTGARRRCPRNTDGCDDCRPAYLYGYTSAVFRFAKHLETNSLPVPFSSPLKGVIMTSETVTLSDLALVERVFSAPAIVEYGAAEIGPVAYSSPGRSGLRVFWTSFIVQADDEGHAVITTTGDRRFPLINYDIGDVIDVGHDQSESLLELPGIRGREADVVRMRTRDGRDT